MRVRLALLITMLFTSLVLFPLSTTSAQGSIQDLIITQTDVTEFPQVTLRFRALDAEGFPVSTAQLGLFEVLENGRNVTPENLTKTEAGIWVHFVVDAGVWLVNQPWANARAAITDFVQTTPWMKENLDYVALTVVPASGAQNLVPFTQNGRDLLPAMQSFLPPRGTQLSEPIPALDAILDEMALMPEAAAQAKFIVFLSSGLESGTGRPATQLAQKARDLRIPIYVIGFRNDQREPLQKLAEESGGRFSLYSRLTDINPLYTQLIAYREQYELTYRSGVNQSGNQQVELNANVSVTGRVSSRTNYDIEVNPPRVLIQNLKTGDTIERRSDVYTADLSTISPTTTSVVATVIFPDTHLRRLQEARLLVNNVVAARLTRPNPLNDLEFVWNLRDVQMLGITNFSLEVEITDELGLVSRSPAVPVKINVIVPPPPTMIPPTPGTPGERVIIVPTAPPTPTPTPIPCTVLPESLCPLERTARTTEPTTLIALGLATFSVIFSILVWINRDKAPVQAVRETLVLGVERITKRYAQQKEAKAYLVVLEGDTNVGKRLEIFGDTPIGRSRQNAELLFQQHDENSPLSRLHCTLINEEDHFLLRDEDSANGTFLNGRKLAPLQPERLHDEDEIELARVERGGVRLRFQLAQSDEGKEDAFFSITKTTEPPNGKGNTGSGEALPF